MLRSIIMIALLSMVSLAYGQRAVSKEIENLQSLGQTFESVSILKFRTQDIQHRDFNLAGLKKGTVIQPDQAAIQLLIQRPDEYVTIPIPITDREEIRLTLQLVDIFAPDFKLFTSEDREHPIDYRPGLHYRGVVEGDPTSIVALSVFKGQVMAMIATDEGNHVIGPIKDDSAGRHVFYNDRDLDGTFNFECGTEDDGLEYTEDQLKAVYNSRDLNDCVRIYIEINDDIVTAKGGAGPATDYITAIMNQSFVLYANDNVSLVISEMLAWTTPSPYTGEDSGANLSIYKQVTHWFNADLSHLITFDSLLGVAASTAGPCSGNPDQRKCVSGIINNFENVPVFSFPVFVVTHEMGHLLGSNHTHACVWNGNGTSIDACGYNGDSPCPGPDPPIPVNGGTIMSYCTPGRGYYINFNEGFGPQPGNLIRNNVNAANNCLYACADLPMYCLSYGNITGNKNIERIILNSIDHTSGNNLGYGNFHSLSTTLTIGNQYTITLDPGSNAGTKYWRAWIDYNDDEDWDDAGEQVVEISGSQVVTASFTVPAGLSPAICRLRVSMAYSGFVPPCGSFETGEVEDYTVVISNTNVATCSDGIQNQGESGIDCGGPCPECPPAPTCFDGIQNQNETGIDCGGPCDACPASDSTILLGSYFETGLDNWVDGGSDVSRVQSANSWEGQYSIKLADNGGTQSAMTSPSFNLSSAIGLQVSFHFFASSMEAGEDFWLLYNNGSGNWVNIGTYAAGTHFNNNGFYFSAITIPNFVPTANGSIRIQCDASDNSDQVFIDAVIITQLNGAAFIESNQNIVKEEKQSLLPVPEAAMKIAVNPNPAKDILHISCTGEIQAIRLINLDGKILPIGAGSIAEKQIDIQGLAVGLYFLWIQSGGEWYPARFIKI